MWDTGLEFWYKMPYVFPSHRTAVINAEFEPECQSRGQALLSCMQRETSIAWKTNMWWECISSSPERTLTSAGQILSCKHVPTDVARLHVLRPIWWINCSFNIITSFEFCVYFVGYECPWILGNWGLYLILW